MMSFSAGKAALGVLFFLFLPLLLSPSHCVGEVLLEPRVGFHGLFKLGHPFPLEIELANLGRPVQGTLEVQVWKGGPARGGQPYPFYYRQEIFLSAQSRKNVQLTVDPDFISRPLSITFSGPGVNLSRELDLRRHFSPAPLMLLLSESHFAPPIVSGSGPSERLVLLALGELPANPRALLGVSTVIIYEQSLRDLSRAQALALEAWLGSGGQMLILGSLNYALYQEPAMSRFLPVRVTGAKKISVLARFNRSYGGQGPPVRDVWVQLSRPIAGRVLIEEQGIPILVEMGRGRGRVLYLALDVGRPPLSRWEGLPNLFRDLLSSTPSGGPTLRTSWDDAVFSQLLLNPSFISTYVPTVSLFAALILYLGGIGLLAWLWQHQRVERRKIVLGIFFFVALSAAAGHMYFSRGGKIPDGVILASTVLDSLPNGYVEAQSDIALFSTQVRRYDLEFEHGWVDLMPVPSRSKDRDAPAFVVRESGVASHLLFPLREWDYKLFKIRSMDRFPLHAEMEQRADKIVLKLTNMADKDLAECWLVVAGREFFLGDIPRGASWTRDFPLVRTGADSAERRQRRAHDTGLRAISFKDRTREILFRRSIFPPESEAARWESSAVLFFGWVEEPDRRVWVEDGRIRAYDHTLFRTILPLEEETDL